MNVSEHLSIVALREGLFLANGVQSRGQNRIREIRPSGIVGRLAKTWAMGAGLRAMGKPVEHPPNPKAARAALLSRHPHAAFDEAGAGNGAWSRCCDTRDRKSETTGNTNFALNRRASPRPD